MAIIRKFPDRPGYSEDITMDLNNGYFRIRWYLYDEYYPGFEDHEYIIDDIPEAIFREAFGLKSSRAIQAFLVKFFKNDISASRFTDLLDDNHIPYRIIPDDEWSPGW